MNIVLNNSQIEIQEKKFISSERVFILLQDIKAEINIPEKLEKIAQIIQRDDIIGDEIYFQKLSSTILWLSKQYIVWEAKISFESLCRRINNSEKFCEFPKSQIQEALTQTQRNVIGILWWRWMKSIRARGFNWWRA
jgi:hypothetical protein